MTEPLQISPFGQLNKGMNIDTNGEFLIDNMPFFIKNINPVKIGSIFPMPLTRVTLSLNANEYLERLFLVEEADTGRRLYAITSAGRVFRINPTNWTSTLLTNSVPVPVVDVVTFNGWTIFVSPNGIRKVDTLGSTIHNFTIPQPSAPSVTAGSSGNLNGTYSWRVAYIVRKSNGEGQLEGKPSAQSNALSLTNQSATLTIPTSSDPQVVARAIYRYGGTVNEWKLVGVVNDNTTTTYIDNTPDSTVIANPTLSLVSETMPNSATAAAVYLNRLFLVNQNRLYFSEVNNCAIYHTATTAEWMGGWIELEKGSGNTTKLIPLGQGLLIFKTNALLLLAGTTPENFTLAIIANNIGVTNSQFVDNEGSVCAFLTLDTQKIMKVYLFSESTLQSIDTGVSQFFNFLQREWTGDEEPRRISVAGQNGSIFIGIKRTGVNGDQNDSETTLTYPLAISHLRPISGLFYDMSTQTWSAVGWTGWTVADVCAAGAQYYIASHGGKIGEWFPHGTGTNPTGAIIVSGWWRSPDGFKWIVPSLNISGKLHATAQFMIDGETDNTIITLPTNTPHIFYVLYSKLLNCRAYRFILKVTNTSGVNVVIHHAVVNLLRGSVI